MTSFLIHSSETAPARSRKTLEEVEAKYGFTPNLFGVFAGAPAAAEAYLALGNAFASSSLSPVEQQIVAIAASTVNGCTYCVAAHSTVATMVKMPAEVLSALRDGRALPDAKLEALRVFTIKAVEKRGWLSDSDLGDFFRAGYNRASVLEVIVGLALKTLSNYTNHIAKTPLDDAFAGQRWEPKQAA
ncbi:MAG: carboxymuconolactone decarboxylase family protein [Proteobacteria bacterium]|nr:carboxymuconolactone decarboxylase family protein [Pseudomonadota bacterium]